MGELGRPDGSQQLTLRLNPEALGEVDLNFTAKGDHLTVTLTASGGAAEAALREGVDDLTRSILQRGDRFQTVEIRIEQREPTNGRQDLRQDDRREGQARGNEGREGGRQQPRREPATTAEAWYDLARGGR